MNLVVSRGLCKSALGAVGYLYCKGQPSKSYSQQQPPLAPILCFHCSPRSSDEYLELLPLLASTGRNVIALDCPGYGISESPYRSCSIDDIADAFLQVADQVLLQEEKEEEESNGNEAVTKEGEEKKKIKYVTIGSLMGNFHAVSLASRYPDRIAACILANLFYFPPQDQADDDGKRKEEDNGTDDIGTPRVDPFELEEDGSHLVKLHASRKWLDLELNLRVVQSELTYLVNRRARYAKGISIQDLNDYKFEGPAQQTICPTLCIRGESCLAFFDAIGFGGTQQFEAGVAQFPDGHVASIEGPKSTLNMINQLPEEFAGLCKDFLETQGI